MHQVYGRLKALKGGTGRKEKRREGREGKEKAYSFFVTDSEAEQACGRRKKRKPSISPCNRGGEKRGEKPPPSNVHRHGMKGRYFLPFSFGSGREDKGRGRK